MGGAIKDFFMSPIKKVQEKAKKLLPGWARKLLGMEEDAGTVHKQSTISQDTTGNITSSEKYTQTVFGEKKPISKDEAERLQKVVQEQQAYDNPGYADEIGAGIITNKGEVIKASEQDTIMASKNPVSINPITPTTVDTSNAEGEGFLGKISNVADMAFDMTPMNMAVDAISNLLANQQTPAVATGGADNAVLIELTKVLKSMKDRPLTAIVSADQATSQINAANTFRT